MIFLCLGNETTSNATLRTEIVYQTNKAYKIPGCLDAKMWDSGFLQELNVGICKSVNRPIVTYVEEMRADTSKANKMLETNEI
jgi:hypothetical protein